MYLVNRRCDDPDPIGITELWRSQADLDASVERISGSPQVAEVLALVERWRDGRATRSPGSGRSTRSASRRR